ncbi:MAG: ABC transporter ATP-binding protein [Culicoidibacterales bacterium]
MKIILQHVTKRDWLFLAISFIFIISQIWLDLKIPEFMSEITRLIQTPGSELAPVLTSGFYMLLCALGSMAAAVFTGFFIAKIAVGISMRLRASVFDKTLDFSTAELNQFSTASLITRCTNDVTQIQSLVAMGLQTFIKAPILAVWAISKISNSATAWTITTALTVLLVVIILASAIAIVYPKTIRLQKLTDTLNRIAREHLTGLRVIRAYNAEQFQAENFEAANSELTNTNLAINRTMAFLTPVLTSISSGLSLAIYAVGAFLIQEAIGPDKLTLFSDMIVMSSYAMQVIFSFIMLVFTFIMLPRAVVSLRRITEVLTTPLSITNGTKTSGTQSGTIEFENVSFSYPDAEEAVIENISFTANKGETVAFIGATGSGKTTLLQMIPRFYDATTGTVRVDGIDVKEFDIHALRNRMSYITQKSILFSGTITDNIAYGENGTQPLTAEQIKRAAEISQASAFIDNKEGQYEAHVAQGGSNFSGGQKQRLSIARAVARDPKIYLFDDSFSALDYKTDKVLRQALREAAKDATLLIVAQRIGTIRNADKIIVLDDGKAVGIGTHSELIATCPVYREIAQSQLSEEELV